MEFLNRYRNLSVLLVAILAQVLMLAYQIRRNQDVRLIRVWAVGAVTPLARVLEAGRTGTSGFFHSYFDLMGVEKENRDLKAERDRLRMENQDLRAQLDTADNAKALSIFIPTSRSKTLAARNIGRTTDSSAQVIMVDRGASDGVQKGQAVRTPEGIVGKVINVFSNVSDVLLVTDPAFAADVVSQKHHVHGTLKGTGSGYVIVDHVENEETVDQGEMFFTSGEDLIFPKGIPAGQVTVARDGRAHKEIHLTPSGLEDGVDDVLIVIEGVHGTIPAAPAPDQPVHLLNAPPPDDAAPEAEVPAQSGQETDLDRQVEKTRKQGQAQGHVFGSQNTPAMNYNLPPPESPGPGTSPPAPSAQPPSAPRP